MEGGLPARGERRAQSRTHREDFHCRVGVTVLVLARESHDPPVAQQGYGRIPAAMGHALHRREGVRSRIEQTGFLTSFKRIICDGAAVDKDPSIRKHSQAVAKHVVADRWLATIFANGPYTHSTET